MPATTASFRLRGCRSSGSIRAVQPVRLLGDDASLAGVEEKDLARVRNHGRDDFAAVIRKVTNHLKTPLADRFPICVLNYRRMGVIAGRWVIEDWSGQRLVMTDRGVAQEPASIPPLALLPADLLEGQTLIVRFCTDLGAGGLEVKPLGAVSQTELIRLTL